MDQANTTSPGGLTDINIPDTSSPSGMTPVSGNVAGQAQNINLGSETITDVGMPSSNEMGNTTMWIVIIIIGTFLLCLLASYMAKFVRK